MSVNGVGPEWAPPGVRHVLTLLSGLFFSEASWTKHDEGYARGCPSRFVCDMKFLKAMLRDAAELSGPVKMAAGGMLAWTFWIAVRLLGWTTYRRPSGHP